MAVKNRIILKQQLECQAAKFVSERNNAELTKSILLTCRVLLDAAKESLDEAVLQDEFKSIYAGYQVIATRVERFFNTNRGLIGIDRSSELDELLKKIQDMHKDIENIENRINTANDSVIKVSERIGKKGSIRKIDPNSSLSSKIEQTKANLNLLAKEIEKSENETAEIKRHIANFDVETQKLAENMKKAKESYDELEAYYNTLKRIRDGIKEEGYVDIESFNNALQEMDNEGKELMGRYDNILKKLSNDVKDLQDEINRRIKK